MEKTLEQQLAEAREHYFKCRESVQSSERALDTAMDWMLLAERIELLALRAKMGALIQHNIELQQTLKPQ